MRVTIKTRVLGEQEGIAINGYTRLFNSLHGSAGGHLPGVAYDSLEAMSTFGVRRCKTSNGDTMEIGQLRHCAKMGNTFCLNLSAPYVCRYFGDRILTAGVLKGWVDLGVVGCGAGWVEGSNGVVGGGG